MILALTNATLQSFVAFGAATVRRIHGMNNNAIDCWIQLHQKIPNSIATPIANGDVPTFKSLYCPANTPFVFVLGEEGTVFNPLVYAVSTTEVNYTAPGGNGGLDISIEYDTLYATNGNETITGDLATGRDSISPWADAVANAGKRVLRVDYTNNDGATRFLLFTAEGGGQDVMPGQVYQVANGATLVLNFGNAGLQMFCIDSLEQLHYGCTIEQSATALTSGITSTAVSYIKALWR